VRAADRPPSAPTRGRECEPHLSGVRQRQWGDAKRCRRTSSGRQDLGDTVISAQQTQPGDRDKSLSRLGQRTVAISEFVHHRGDAGFIGGGQPTVGLQPQSIAGDVLRRQVGVDRHIDADVTRLLDSVDHLAVSRGTVGLDSLPDQPHIQIEADSGDVTGLLGAQHVAGSPNLQVLQCNRHTGTQFVVLGDRGQPVVGGLGERRLAWIKEVGVPAFAAAPHPAAQLVQLREAERLGPLHDQGVGIGDVQTGLDDRRADQDVVVAVPEPLHRLLQLLLGHLPMRNHHACLGHQGPDPRRCGVNGADPVVHIEHLPVAQQFTTQRRGDLLVVIRTDIGQYRIALLGRGEDGRHLPDTGQAHLQRPRDRGGAHGQHVDVGAKALDVFLVLDTEPLFLIDHHQAEVLPAHRSL
jgi:hypothetical protein